MGKYKRCPESDCFAYKNGTCRVLLEVPESDCAFYKPRWKHLKDVREAAYKWVKG